MSVYKKLSEIQKRLFVPKGQKNDFGKYNYRSCEDILKTVKPLCDENQCVLSMSNDIKQIGDRNYVEAQVTLVDLETNESIVSIAHAREDIDRKGMSGDQLTGAASSYARKYALAGLFCIDNEKDSDATNTHGKEAVKDFEDSKVTEEDVQKILLGISKVNVKAEDICKKYKVKELKDLTQGQYLEIKKEINEAFVKMAKEAKE